MKKVLWVSKNTPLESQIQSLKNLFGQDVRVDIDSNPFSSAQDVVRRFRRGSYDEMVLIAPLSVCRMVTEQGVKPLWSEMETVPSDDPQAEVRVQGTRERLRNTHRCYKFIKFKRLESIEMVFSDLVS